MRIQIIQEIYRKIVLSEIFGKSSLIKYVIGNLLTFPNVSCDT